MPNQIPSHSNKISFFTKILKNFLYSSNYPLKSWIFNSHFSYKVKQLNPQLSFKLQYKACWVLYKMKSSFSPPFLFLQAPLHSPPTIPSSTSAIFPSIPFPTCLQNHPYNPTNTPLTSTPQPSFASFYKRPFLQTQWKIFFPTFATQSIQTVKKADTVLISPCFPEAQQR